MNEPMLTPPKKRSVFSPILIELTIVILFFALSTSVVVQLIAAASASARESEYHARAILAMESVAESIKANPTSGAECNECGARVYAVQMEDDLAVNCIVTDDPTPEQTAFKYMYERGDQAKIAQVGFSLLDMKNYLQQQGYEADGYKAPLETLADA